MPKWQQDVGRSINGKGHLKQSQTNTMNMLLDSREKATLVIKCQTLDCIVLCASVLWKVELKDDTEYLVKENV